jgi:hypothetical protein
VIDIKRLEPPGIETQNEEASPVGYSPQDASYLPFISARIYIYTRTSPHLLGRQNLHSHPTNLATMKQRILTTILLAAAPAALAAPSAPPHTRAETECFKAFTGWTVTDLEYHASYIFTTPAHQNSWGYVNFNVSNPAVPYTIPCSGTSNQLSDFFYGTMVYKCKAPENATNGGDTSFTYNRSSGELVLNQTWVCHDDPQWP